MGWLRSLESPAEETGQNNSEWKREIHEEVGSPTLCSHAFAVGGTVFRIANDEIQNHHDGAPWWSWQKVVEPGSIVTHLSCNRDGSVIVAATDVGTVELLRGCDGRRLAYQQVSVTNVQWISDSSLWIETDDEITLVDHVDGEQLNHETDERAVSRATRKLKMTNISLKNFVLRTFTILPSRTVVACNVDGKLQLLEIQDGTLTQSDTVVNTAMIGEIDYGVGLHPQQKSGASVVAGCSLQHSDRVIFWFDAKENSIACTYVIPNVVVADDLKPLQDHDSELEALTLAVATRITSGAQIHILQVLVDGESVSNPHSLYTISEEATATGMTIAPVADKQCTLRYRIWTKAGGSDFKAFEPYAESVSKLRRVRSLLARKEVDSITDQLVSGLDDSQFSQFHPSEIEFVRLCNALSQDKGATAVSQLLRKMIAGAKASDIASDWLIRGIRHVIQTPSNFTLQQFHAGVSLLPRLLESLVASLSKTNQEKLRAVLRTVGRKAQALTYLVDNQIETELPFSQIRSVRHLYEVLIQEGRIDSAKDLVAKDLIPLDDLVLPILQTKPPGGMVVLSLLRDSIFPRLSIGDDIVPRIKHWAVQFAEQSEDICQSIEVLEIVNGELNRMHDRIHSCFGNYSPFAADLGKTLEKGNVSSDSSTYHDTTEFDIDVSKIGRRGKTVVSKASFPTILQQTNTAAMRLTRLPVDDRTSISEEDVVFKKLTDARCIQDARALGLGQEYTDLCRFEGADDVAKELCRIMEVNRLLQDLVPFCEKYNVDFNQVLAGNIGQLCRGRDVTEATIIEACSLAYLCLTLPEKCNAALVVLRAARVFGTPNNEIFQLADKSIQWSVGDQTMREELFEASRLLQIDAIVIKYCGDSARQMFRVEDPRHSLRLFHFVCDHGGRREGVVNDALSMCRAFSHLSEHLAAGKILESALLRQEPDLCNTLFQEIIKFDPNLAMSSMVRTILTAEIVAQQHKGLAGFAENVYECVSSLIMTAREKGLSLNSDATAAAYSYFERADLREMRERLVDVVALRRTHSVSCTLQMLRNISTVVEVATHQVSAIVEESGHVVESNLKATKQVCTLLCSRKGVASDVWAVAVATATLGQLRNPQSTHFVFPFLRLCGLLSPGSPNQIYTFCQSVVAVGMIKTAVQKCFTPEITFERAMQSFTIVADWSLRQSALQFIGFVMTFSESLEVVKRAMEKSDDGFGDLTAMLLSKYRDSVSKSVARLRLGQFRSPRLHDSWYVGDGLLLPPKETLECALEFLVGRWQHGKGVAKMANLLSSKGTHFFQLQILCQSASMLGYRSTSRDEARLALVQDLLMDSVKAIAERSLGGTGYGITSSVIDSQNSLSLLLEMPIKDAFSIFKVCIPMALKRQSFSRLQVLANIGFVASVESSQSQEVLSWITNEVGWVNQDKFNVQCASLAERSTWWNILSENGIDFDSKLFDEGKSSSGKCSDDLAYAESILLLLMSKLSSTLSISQVLEVSGRYASAFRLQSFAPVTCMIEHLLRPATAADEIPYGTSNYDSNDVRLLLTKIREPFAALTVLRRCLRKVEQSAYSKQDYELWGDILQLYYENLTTVLNGKWSTEKLPSSKIQSFRNEKGLVERRLDALSVLSSFYQGNRKSERPSLSGLFKMLPERIEDSQIQNVCPVLKPLVQQASEESSFDPLSSLTVPLADLDEASISALAPLCSPLGLPSGFLHARWLMRQFQISLETNSNLPKFDETTRSVLNRLSLSHRTELAEWCFSIYSKTNNKEKLQCLNALLECTVQQAMAAEERSNTSGETDTDAENRSMELITHMTSLKDSLSRVLDVKKSLLDNGTKTSQAITRLCLELSNCLDTELMEKGDLSIEEIIDFVLCRGSELAAETCLTTSGFTLQQFRCFSEKVHSCCREITEFHYERARDLANKWLFHGDDHRHQEYRVKGPTQLSPLQKRDKPSADHKEDFVMDISEIQIAADEWQSVDGTHQSTGLDDKVIVDEELSSIDPCSIRETSEFRTQRASLRIAFVMAFSKAPAVSHDKSKENVKNQNLSKSAVQRLLADKSCQDDDDDDLCEMHSKFLMGIVFAKGHLSSDETALHSIPKDIRSVTFAMRHRALRVASILCPHDILDKISPTCLLPRCCFGVFVAKEVEEMGLTLPHSDLVQLSSMNFATYARTLWMQHRKDDLKSQGRFLLLLCEMILKESTCDDNYLSSVLEEIIRLRLPRTLLLAMNRVSCAFSKSSTNQRVIHEAVDICVTNIVEELTSFTQDLHNERCQSVLSTLKMTDKILKGICDQGVQSQYIDKLLDVIKFSGGTVDTLCAQWGRKSKTTNISELPDKADHVE